MLAVGVIGYGRRIQDVIGLMRKLHPGAEIVAVTDKRGQDIIDKPMGENSIAVGHVYLTLD